MMLKRWVYLSLLGCLAIAPSAHAQAQPAHPCAAKLLPAERLSCYDAAFPPTGDVQGAVRQQAVQAFGQRDAGPILRNPGQSAEEVDPSRIEARVLKVDYGPAGRLVTLANDQAWKVLDASGQGHLNEGDMVSIRKAALGGYQLITAAGVGLRVRRVR